MEALTKDWTDFYMSRVKSDRYYNHFTRKYKPFLDMILRQSSKGIFEAGCGLGMVSLALKDDLESFSGLDLCPHMAKLARFNTDMDVFFQGDMFQNTTNELTVTHGVLEHFEDDMIIEAVKRYPNSVHYVPLDKYVTPSFGDERLLPYQYWLDLVEPKEWEVFNDGLDLTFKI